MVMRAQALAPRGIRMKPYHLAMRILAIVVIGLLVLTSSFIDEGVMAETITTFHGGGSSVEIALEAGVSNSDTNLYVPVAGTVKSATFDVTGMENGDNNYPNRLQTMVGSMGKTVYMWAGRTYGPMGLQGMFTNFQTSEGMVFENAGDNDSLSIRLPEGASITSATMRVTGALYDAGWAYPIKLSHKVGNNQVPIIVGFRGTPDMIDYDGDGDLDMLTGGYQYVGPGNIQWLHYFENIGTKTAPKWKEDPSVVDIDYQAGFYYAAPRFVDLDDDDDYDIVTGMYDGRLRVFWNTGSNSNPSWSDDGTGTDSVFYGIDEGYYASPDFADMDNDGDLDLAYGKYSTGTGGSNVGISSYRNDYSNGNFSWSTSNFFGSISSDQYSYPAIVDFDEDGDNDIFVGYYNGTIGYYENTGTKSNPSWTHVPYYQGSIDIGTMASPAVGDMNDDGDLDLVVGSYDGAFYYYERVLSSPEDVSLDIGGDGSADWTKSGELLDQVTTSNMATAFENNLKGTYSSTDEWGNNFFDVKVKVSTKAAGGITLDQIRIEYVYTAASKDFAGILNEFISNNLDKADDQGNLKVPVIVGSGAKGKLKLSNLEIVIDMPPAWSAIPSTYGVDEDTKNMQLIDLFAYISDDFTSDDHLSFKVLQYNYDKIVPVTLENGRYIGVDAETGSANDNWHGTIDVGVIAWDVMDQFASFNFTIEVRPINDAPEVTGVPPSTTLEDDAISYQIEASDVDGDTLSFIPLETPSTLKVSDTGLITWTPTNDDVGIHNITIMVSDPFNETAFLVWILEVINVNDAPYFNDLPKTLSLYEGEPTTIDLKGTYGDVDDPTSSLKLMVENGFSEFDEATKVITLFYPKETGIKQDKLMLIVVDPHRASAERVIILEIILVDKLDMIGIPDQLAVEDDHWTLDIKPYLYNVEDYNQLEITTTSAFISVDGTKLNLHYPQGQLPDLKESITVTATQKDEVAKDEFIVELLVLGYDLTLTIIPDQDVLEDEAIQLDITPYIKNAPAMDEVTVTIKASEHVSLNGRVLTFLYPMYYGPESEVITVTIAFGNVGSSRDFKVNILNAEDDFYLADIPEVTITETVPETFNIKQYIRNADDVDRIDAWTDSPYADVNRFDIQLTYPDGFTEGEKVRDDLIRITISDGIHEFTRALTIHVLRLGKELQLAGIGDQTVYQGTDLVIDISTYLYNVDEIDEVSVTCSPDTYAAWDGMVVTFNYPMSVSMSMQEVTFTATEGPDVSIQRVMIYIERIPEVFTFGPIGSFTALEDVPYVLDVEPYLVNMAGNADYDLGIHSDHATIDGFIVTFLYEVEESMDEIVRINVTGTNGDFAEQDIYVHVKAVNDPPTLLEPIMANIQVQEGKDAFTIDLTEIFADGDTAVLNYSCDEDVIVIDWENDVATIEFEDGAEKPDDLNDVVIWAFDPDETGSRLASNEFNVNPGIQEPEGGSAWLIIALLALTAIVGGGWMYYRKRKPTEL